jgi:methionyl-tRNA synthetase
MADLRREMAKFYITTPIYYVNDNPHLGHAYCTILADFFARYHRLMDDETRFLTGTDEHGQKVQKTAEKEGVTPKELADRVVTRYQNLWKKLDISHDDFIRTTEDRHSKGVLFILKKMLENGDVYKDSYEGPYCVACESFFPDKDIVEGKCPDFGHPVTVLKEESYFFRLSKFEKPLLKLYKDQPSFVMPESRMNEVRTFVASGLKDLSISRTSITWGIPFPDDEKHVLYVWLDALSNYVSALGLGSGNDKLYQDFWPAELHLIGKDILRFHAVYWPAFLMSAGLPLPKHVFGHGWWMKDQNKMSKSIGNIVDPVPYVDQFGSDVMRYFLLREKPIGTDGSFSDEAFIDRLNADLANDLGNFASRLTTLLDMQFEGKISEGDGSLKETALKQMDNYHKAMESFQPKEALEYVWTFISQLNKYLVERAPWTKAGTKESEDTLSEAARALRLIALQIAPVMPHAAGTIMKSLGFRPALFPQFKWDEAQETRAFRVSNLFPRVDKKEYFADVATADKKTETKVEAAVKAESPLVTIDDFRKIVLRAGKIIQAERVPKSSKLIRMIVDFGDENRQIVGGIGKKYQPEDLVGKTCPFVFNLEPAKLMGVESNGMIMAGNLDGEPILLQFMENVPPGSKIS